MFQVIRRETFTQKIPFLRYLQIYNVSTTNPRLSSIYLDLESPISPAYQKLLHLSIGNKSGKHLR